MSNIIKKKRLTQEDIEKMMADALIDAFISCPYCNFNALVPNYKTCPNCKKLNPLRVLGYITEERDEE